jgi:hypothetical protein
LHLERPFKQRVMVGFAKAPPRALDRVHVISPPSICLQFFEPPPLHCCRQVGAPAFDIAQRVLVHRDDLAAIRATVFHFHLELPPQKT